MGRQHSVVLQLAMHQTHGTDTGPAQFSRDNGTLCHICSRGGLYRCGLQLHRGICVPFMVLAILVCERGESALSFNWPIERATATSGLEYFSAVFRRLLALRGQPQTQCTTTLPSICKRSCHADCCVAAAFLEALRCNNDGMKSLTPRIGLHVQAGPSCAESP